MSRSPLPPRVSAEFASIDAATRSLIRAAEAGDPEAIERAVTRRAEAIDRLEPMVRELRREWASALPSLESESRAASEQVRLAEEQLRALVERTRRSLESWVAESHAIRTYAGESSAPALDRSG